MSAGLDSEHARLTRLAYDVHEEARANTAAHSFIVGSVMRGIANRILHELGEVTLPYEGPAEPADWDALADEAVPS